MTDQHTADQEPGDEPSADHVRDDSAASGEHHDAATHMDAHTTISDDDHGHAEDALGPIDWGAWAFALLGAASALVVVVLFWVATN